MIFLVQFQAYNLKTNQVDTLRFSDAGYTTRPNDAPANAHFQARVQQPGNYSRSIFSLGTTGGEIEAAFGYIQLANADGGIDYLADMAVDGRELMIWTLDNDRSPWTSRQLLFRGTMEQIEHEWTTCSIRIRDRLALLRENIQTVNFAGTTTSGGMNEAEGNVDDLKDKPKPLLFGTAQNITPPLSNSFDLIATISSNGFSSTPIVKDGGVPLTYTQNYDTIQALRTATLQLGQFATASALGLVRFGARATKEYTVTVTEGTAATNSAARLVQRILQYANVPNLPFNQADLDALHALNPSPFGIWIDTTPTETLEVVNRVLDSIGAYAVPDRNGSLRFGRVDPPTGTAVARFDKALILDRGGGIKRLVTNDQGRGVPAKSLKLNYSRNYTVQDDNSFAGAATEAERSFSKEQFRSTRVESADNANKFLLATELELESLLIDPAAATAEANRRFAIYGVKRDRFQLPLKSEYVKNVDLGQIVEIQANRYDLNAGKKFLVIGILEDYRESVTTLDLYG